MEIFMNSNEFNYIKEVATKQSFSKASKALGISQPALSNYVKKIEDRLGVPLFDRSISPIEITEFGKAYLEYANEVLSAAEKLENIMSDLQDLKQGQIKIGSTVCFSTGYLPGSIASFHKEYPGISFNVIDGRVPDIMNKCLTGDVDMFLTDGRIDDELFDKEELFKERLVMAVPKELEINEKIKDYRIPVEDILNDREWSLHTKKLDLKEMKYEGFVLLNEDQHIRQMVDHMFESAGYEPKVVLQTSQSITGFAMSVANVGVSFVTETTIKYNNIGTHAYYYKVGDEKEAVRCMCIAYKKGKYISNAGRKFIETLKKELG